MSIPIYISLTSIFNNQDILLKTLKSIKNQSIIPTKCYIYLSEEPYLLDIGFKNKLITNNELKTYIQNNKLFELIWINNNGPYRKLLPLLNEKLNEDYLIKNLINDYNEYNCVISYRGFTMKLDNNNIFDYENKNKTINLHLYNFFTGKGGVLYHPKFFHNTNNLIFDEKLYLQLCKTTDDIWFNFIRICNNINCYIIDKQYMTHDNTSSCELYGNYNSKNKLNTINMKNTIIKLRELGYII
jgi:hypothetical protein